VTPTSRIFALPNSRRAKADPALIADDERHLALIAHTVEQTIAELKDRLTAERRRAAGNGQHALDRDIEIHRLTKRLRALDRFGDDICLGRMVQAGDSESIYVGRLGLSDQEGRRLLIDWRSPAAEPFSGATHARPLGIAGRRRYRWTGGRVTDYWDEVFSEEATAAGLGRAGLDDRSAFIASLAGSRSHRMRDVLGTIQADQDAIIREGSRGVLVVDGGPGTGKTVVALHRTAYLLYSDPRLAQRRGGVLFVGPNDGYLSYIDDVLPSLGEEGVQVATMRDLVPEGAAAHPEPDAATADLKAGSAVLEAIEAAVALYERPPAIEVAGEPVETVDTSWGELQLGDEDWAEAFEAASASGAPHNDARDDAWDRLMEIAAGRLDDSAPLDALSRELSRSDLGEAFLGAWPLLDPAALVAQLWSSPQFLSRCAPELTRAEVASLQRPDPRAWTVADLPLLDAARHRIGDPEAGRERRRRAAVVAAERSRRAQVIDELIAGDDSELMLMSMLRGQDAQNSLDDDDDSDSDSDSDSGSGSAGSAGRADAAALERLAGPFAHIVVDEAQELSDAEWRMLHRRCPSRSFTVVGDRAQARRRFEESWAERLGRVGLGAVNVARLTINYRTPIEVMAEAEPVIRSVLPDANVPQSVRRSGVPVRHGSAAALESVVADWLAQNAEGTVCVVVPPRGAAGSDADDAAAAEERRPTRAAAGVDSRVRTLSPGATKGLEFDLVVLVLPADAEPGMDATGDLSFAAAVDRYVAMTRATRQLIVLSRTAGELAPGPTGA
jgi:DNA helicase IV